MAVLTRRLWWEPCLGQKFHLRHTRAEWRRRVICPLRRGVYSFLACGVFQDIACSVLCHALPNGGRVFVPPGGSPLDESEDKRAAACSSQKKREGSPKPARPQWRYSVGMSSDSTQVSWLRSLMCPSGVTTNDMARPVTGHIDWIRASARSCGG